MSETANWIDIADKLLTVNMLGLHQQRDCRAAEYDRFRAFRLQPIYYLQIRSA